MITFATAGLNGSPWFCFGALFILVVPPLVKLRAPTPNPQLLAEGKSNKEVAAVLDVSVYTVDTDRLHPMQKLNLHNTAEIVLYAVRKKSNPLTSV